MKKINESSIVQFELKVAEKIIGTKLPILGVPFEDLWRTHIWLDEQRIADKKKYQDNINNTVDWLPNEYKKLKNKIIKNDFNNTYEDPKLALFFNHCIFVEINSTFNVLETKSINYN